MPLPAKTGSVNLALYVLLQPLAALLGLDDGLGFIKGCWTCPPALLSCLVPFPRVSQRLETTLCENGSKGAGLAWWLRRSAGKRRDAGTTPRFGPPFS